MRGSLILREAMAAQVASGSEITELEELRRWTAFLKEHGPERRADLRIAWLISWIVLCTTGKTIEVRECMPPTELARRARGSSLAASKSELKAMALRAEKRKQKTKA